MRRCADCRQVRGGQRQSRDGDGSLPPAPRGPERGLGFPWAGLTCAHPSPRLPTGGPGPARPPQPRPKRPYCLLSPPRCPNPSLPDAAPPPPCVLNPLHPLHHQCVLLSRDERSPPAPGILMACVLTLGDKASLSCVSVLLSVCLSPFII